MLKKIKVLVGGGLLLALASAASAEPGVSMSETTIKSRVGERVSMDIQLSDFPSTEGGGLDITYDPALVRVNSVTVDGSTWRFVNRNGDIDNAAGTVTGILFSSYEGVSGNARIATIELEFVGKGRGDITLSESGANPFAGDGERITATFSPTRVLVRP